MLIKLDQYDTNEIIKSEGFIGKCKRIEIGEDTYIEVDELLSIIEELNYELEETEDRFREYVQDVDDNYRQISHAEQYGISNRDFI